MIKILFFGWVRELMGISYLNIKLEYDNVSDLRTAFAEQHENWALALESNKLLVAVNHQLVSMNHPLQIGDEIAFFPPITGG